MKDPQRVGSAGPAGAALRRGPSLWRAPPGGDPAAIAKFTRDDLVGFQQRWLRPDNAEDLRRFRPPAERGPGRARERVRQLGGAGGGQGRQELSRRARRARRAANPAGRPAGLAAVDDPRRPAAAGRPAQRRRRRSTSPTKRSAATSCRGSTWTCARPRAGPTASAGRSASCPNGVPTSISAPVQADKTGGCAGRAERGRRGVPGDQGHDRRRAQPRRRPTASTRCRASSRRRARCSAMMRNDLMAAPTIITRRWRAKYKAVTAAGPNQAIRAQRSIPRASPGSWSATRPS